MRLKPAIDQRFPKKAFNKTQDRQALGSFVGDPNYGISQQTGPMEELCPEEGAKFTPISKQRGSLGAT